jgi:hypothetical protein
MTKGFRNRLEINIAVKFDFGKRGYNIQEFASSLLQIVKIAGTDSLAAFRVSQHHLHLKMVNPFIY